MLPEPLQGSQNALISNWAVLTCSKSILTALIWKVLQNLSGISFLFKWENGVVQLSIPIHQRRYSINPVIHCWLPPRRRLRFQYHARC